MISVKHVKHSNRYLKVKRWTNIFLANGKKKKAGVATLIKIKLKLKKITRDKDGHYIMIKGLIQDEDITIVNINAPNIRAIQFIRQALSSVQSLSRVRIFATP